MMALSKRNDEPERASRPYDKGRDGFVFGEGAGVLVLESARARGGARGDGSTPRSPAPGITSDGHHIAQPDPDGRRRDRARCAFALEDAGVTPGRHRAPQRARHLDAAGRRRRGQRHPRRARRRVDHVAVSATKSMTGHLLGAAGAVESIATVLALHHRTAPPTINLDDPDDDVDLDVVSGEPRAPLPGRRHRRPLNNSFGFGGHNVALALPERVVTARAQPAVRRRTTVDPRNPKVRLAALFDPGSFTTITAEDDSGMLAGDRPDRRHAGGRLRSDPTVQGGAMGVGRLQGRSSPRTPARWPTAARSSGCGTPAAPGCARASLSLHAVGEVFAIMTRASGRIPQISVVLGAAAGGAAYGPALTDIVILGPAGRVFVTGPDVVRSVTGEDVDMERLGGPEPHGRRSGVVHVTTDTEAEALGAARTIAPLLGAAGRRSATVDDVDLGGLLPDVREAGVRRAPARRAGLLDEGTGARAARAVGAEHRRRRWAASAAAPSASSRTTRCGSAAASTRRRPRRPPGSCGCATRSACRWSCSSTCPATCPASARSGRASSAAAPSCCTRSPSASCRGSPW